MANKVACSLLIPNLLASLSSGCAFFAMNWPFIWESSDALTIFSMSSIAVDFSFMMLLFCRFHWQNKNKTLPILGRVGVFVKNTPPYMTRGMSNDDCSPQYIPNANTCRRFFLYFFNEVVDNLSYYILSVFRLYIIFA